MYLLQSELIRNEIMGRLEEWSRPTWRRKRPAGGGSFLGPVEVRLRPAHHVVGGAGHHHPRHHRHACTHNTPNK